MGRRGGGAAGVCVYLPANGPQFNQSDLSFILISRRRAEIVIDGGDMRAARLAQEEAIREPILSWDISLALYERFSEVTSLYEAPEHALISTLNLPFQFQEKLLLSRTSFSFQKQFAHYCYFRSQNSLSYSDTFACVEPFIVR